MRTGLSDSHAVHDGAGRGELWLVCLWILSLTVGLDLVHELKPYDLIALVGIVFCWGRLQSVGWRTDHVTVATITVFLFTAVVGVAVTFARTERMDWMLVVGLRAYRLLGYLFLFLLVRRLPFSRPQLTCVLGTVILAVGVQAALIVLQYFGLLPIFWPEDEWHYRELTPSGTLGLNHLNSVLFMSVGIAAVSAAFSLLGTRNLFRLALSGLAVAMVAAMLMGEARSAIFAVVMLVPLLLRRGQGRLLVTLAVLLGAALAVTTHFNVADLSFSLWERRIGSRIAVQASAVHSLASAETMRPVIWREALGRLMDRPDMLLVGAGFQNFGALGTRASAGHNTYLHVLAELGIVGAAFYLIWLRSIWVSLTDSARGQDDPVVVHVVWAGLVCFVTLAGLAVFNETLYPSRALPGFMGFALAFLGLCAHPGWHAAEDGMPRGVQP